MYVLTNKWMLAKKVQNTQDTVHRTQKGHQAEGLKREHLSPTWEGEESNHNWGGRGTCEGKWMGRWRGEYYLVLGRVKGLKSLRASRQNGNM